MTNSILVVTQSTPESELRRVTRLSLVSLRSIGLFSIVINLLMLTMPIYMLQVYDRVITTGHLETLISLTLIAIGAFLALGVLDMLRSTIGVRTACWFEEQLSPVFLSISVQAQLKGRPLGIQPLRDLSEIRALIASPSLNIFFDAPWVPIFVILIWLLHPALGVLAICGALLLLLLSIVNDRLTRQPSKEVSASSVSAMQQAESTVRNAETISAMGMLPAIIKNWRMTFADILRGTQRAGERASIILGLGKFCRFTLQMGVLGLGAYLVLLNELSPGSMIAGSILLGRALAPVEMAMSAWRNITSARIAYDRLLQCLNENPLPERRLRLPAPQGKITAEELTYYDPIHRTPILRRVSFNVEPGEVLVVVGPSGAGKSTLCRFLVGVAKPNSGSVRIDGSDIQHWNMEHLGQYLGYLPQSIELFAGTVRENIARLGQHDDNAVVQAAMLAQAHEMIQRLPNGYDTEIGHGGAKLSGGQRQRIGLARAVYGDPRILVLDEPNSNLDQAGEMALITAIQTLKSRGVATVIVGHRRSTLTVADKIMVLQDGAVALLGQRDEVLSRLRNRQANVKSVNARPTDKQPQKTVPPEIPGSAPQTGKMVSKTDLQDYKQAAHS